MVRRHVRRGLFAALCTATLLVLVPVGTAGAADPVPARVCDFDWQRGPWNIRHLIRCAAARWDSPGTPRQAVAVAVCESDLRPDAYSNGYAGLFQQATRYWTSRSDHYGQPQRSVFNGRANIIVSVRMAAEVGSWSPWYGCG